MTGDPALGELRERIAAIDRAILDAVNERLRIVERIRAHKAEHGLDFLDPERERWLHEHLAAANAGPLSEEGLRELLAEILDLTKREVAGGEG